MNTLFRIITTLFLAVIVLPTQAQIQGSRSRGFSENIIMPQSRVFSTRRHLPQHQPVRIAGVDVEVNITEQVAVTEMVISLHNPSNRGQEAELVMPVPDKAIVRQFSYEMQSGEPNAVILPRPEARRIYNEIVAKAKDPALLEFIGYNLVRSSVFPVAAGKTQKVTLIYENLLPADGGRVDYTLPRSESVNYFVPWSIKTIIKSERPISTAYSPSHAIKTKRKSDNKIVVEIKEEARNEPGPFMLSYLLDSDGISSTFLAYPDPKVGGGYFLLLAGVPAAPKKSDGPGIKREITVVLDRSGSMRGKKIAQAREAAMQIINGLEKGERFNIIVYNDTIDMFSSKPVKLSDKNIEEAEEFLNDTKAKSGTNIHDALVEALRQKPSEEMLPIVIFLTDGLATVGQTSEVAIRDAVLKGNPYERRIFTFGVGNDVNTPLLDKIAEETRARATFVLPNEDVEVKVGQVYKRLKGPVLASPEIAVKGNSNRVRDMLPTVIPDMFEGEQLVLLGQYKKERPIKFELSGNYMGKSREFTFKLDPDKATTRNAFVPRLWASRKIGVMTDALRQMGANGNAANTKKIAQNDPKVKELVDEIIRLSTEFGILTEYTAFLAREDQPQVARGAPVLEDLSAWGAQFRGGRTRAPVSTFRPKARKGKSNSAPSAGQPRGVQLSSGAQINLPATIRNDTASNIMNSPRDGMAGVSAQKQLQDMKGQSELNRRNVSKTMLGSKRLYLHNRGYEKSEVVDAEMLSGYGMRGPTSNAIAVQQISDRTFYKKSGNWVDSRLLKEGQAARPERVVAFGSDDYFTVVDQLTKQNRQGCIALDGNVLMQLGKEAVLIQAPGPVVWSVGCFGYFDPSGKKYKIANNRVDVDLSSRTPQVPTGLGQVTEGQTDIKELVIKNKVSEAGEYWLYVIWNPDGSGSEQFEVLCNGKSVGKSDLIDATKHQYQTQQSKFKVNMKKGINNITFQYLSGDGMHFEEMLLSNEELKN
jgi:Ca-activated chloride channel homolog